MRLTLFALSCPPPESPQSIRMEFGADGGRIGRGTACTMVLRDPNRHISREHVEIRVRDSEFVLKVVSKVNSVAVNETPLGPGEAVTLSDGDQLAIGDYVLEAAVDVSARLAAPFAAPQDDPFDLFARRDAPLKSEPQHDTSPDWFKAAAPAASAQEHADTRQAPFDALLDGSPAASPLHDVLSANGPALQVVPPSAESSPISDGIESFLRSLDAGVLSAGGTAVVAHPELYRPDSMQVPFQPVAPLPPLRAPASAAGAAWDEDIFKALDEDFGNRPVEPKQTESAAVAPLPGRPPAIEPAAGPMLSVQTAQPSAASGVGDESVRLMDVLAEALGLQPGELDADRPEETVRVVGQLLRLATDGLFRMLEMRSQLKAELRIEDRTMIASRENNPLKHADSAHDAVTYLVDLRQHGNKLFMPPARAVEDTISDICAHEVAIMAGTRAALLAALKMFSPEIVEKRIKKTGALENVVPALHKSRLWERFLSMYAELEQEAEQNFDRLLNAEFAKAYSEQSRLLRKRR